MFERKLHCHTRQIRHRRQCIARSCRGFAKSNIGNQVSIGNRSEHSLTPPRKEQLPVPSVVKSAKRILVNFVPVFQCDRVLQQISEPSRVTQFRPTLHLDIVIRPNSAPRSPAPNRDVQTKKITVWSVSLAALKIAATDHADALVLAKPFQEFFAKRKKALIRQAIVFQNDRLFDLLEHPINAIDDRARRLASFSLAGAIQTRAVRDDEQFRWTCLCDFSKDELRPLRPIENNKGNRCFQSLNMRTSTTRLFHLVAST